ncbi:lipopolysaccharide biosynthesis protein [Romboutsia ilealis]|uniref:Lipopolysaccharide biosynthesis protein n=1 Tax=Romboutsia faecis TaxID=2764597 RepID=A0ABR7JLP8_9FIRM|nr:Wzz/FepE/Etk N-terminal domain-containing protein [Romboutsia faecis]MBC5995834.1 lipopolysaccharide biosynthesis protein [Romboutsia faecis]MRN23033.1 lipopolysaccharide biosynthesis protein [Romboutsia ilealis]
MEKTIDLKECLSIIKSKWRLISILMIVFMIISVALSFFVIEPVYETNTTLIVNKSEESESKTMTGDEYSVAQRLAVTYGKIITSRTVINEVIRLLNLNMTYEELSSNINVSTLDDTQIINISVQDSSKTRAMNIANTIPKVFGREVTRITTTNEIKVIDRAIVPSDHIKPNKVIYIATGILLGLATGIFLVLISEYIDTRIKKPEDIQRYLNIPTIGVIPKEEV